MVRVYYRTSSQEEKVNDALFREVTRLCIKYVMVVRGGF